MQAVDQAEPRSPCLSTPDSRANNRRKSRLAEAGSADLSHQAAVFVDVAFPLLLRPDCCRLGAAGESVQPVTRATRNTTTAMTIDMAFTPNAMRCWVSSCFQKLVLRKPRMVGSATPTEPMPSIVSQSKRMSSMKICACTPRLDVYGSPARTCRSSGASWLKIRNRNYSVCRAGGTV